MKTSRIKCFLRLCLKNISVAHKVERGGQDSGRWPGECSTIAKLDK